MSISYVPGTILGTVGRRGEALHKVGKVPILRDLKGRETVHQTMNKRNRKQKSWVIVSAGIEIK